MTNEKAREYFSAYSEGTLDAGLAHSFEAKLKADSSLKFEYDQFASMLMELESLRDEEIEVPFDLNDRISAAIDKNAYDRKRAAKPAWTLWLRNLSFAGLTAVALYGAYVSINAIGGNTAPAQIGPGQAPESVQKPESVEQLQFKKTDAGVQMFFQPSEPHKVEVKGGEEGLTSYMIDKAGRYVDLTNPQPTAVAFVVTVEGEAEPTVVVVPGSERRLVEAVNGSVVELAKAVADQFGVPVVVRSVHKDSELAWKLEDDAMKSLQSTLSNPQFSVSNVGDVIHIESN